MVMGDILKSGLPKSSGKDLLKQSETVLLVYSLVENFLS